MVLTKESNSEQINNMFKSKEAGCSTTFWRTTSQWPLVDAEWPHIVSQNPRETWHQLTSQ